MVTLYHAPPHPTLQFNETLIWLATLLILMQSHAGGDADYLMSILEVVRVTDPPPPPPPPPHALSRVLAQRHRSVFDVIDRTPALGSLYRSGNKYRVHTVLISANNFSPTPSSLWSEVLSSVLEKGRSAGSNPTCF